MLRMPPEATSNLKLPRRLAAILAADIAGYSALMGADEERTVRDLKAHQAVVLPMIGDHGGRIVDTAGDGILADFSSVLGAVRCALAIQRVMAERNAAVDPQKRMQFRIGINQGDVVFDDARLYGDGVNVAARLEGIAEPGGICVSGKVYEEVARRIDATFLDLGPQRLKNIAEPVRVYRVGSEAGTGRQRARGTDGSRRAMLLGGGTVALALLLAVGIVNRSALLGTLQTPASEVASASPSAVTPPGPSDDPHLSPFESTDKGAPEERAGKAPLTAEEERQLRASASFRECESCPEMIVVPAGDFLMGSPDAEPGRLKFEGPVHKVTIANPISVGRHAVTRDQFRAFVEATSYPFGDSCHAQTSSGWVDMAKHSFLSPPKFSQQGDHPVVCISWKDADAYVRWLSANTGKAYRLPTEAEREYIARAGTSTPYWWGHTVSLRQANFDTQPRPAGSPRDTAAPAWEQRFPRKAGEPPAAPRIVEPGVASGGTRPVDWGQPNPWSFLQVHGNVAEWVQDCWNPNYARTPADGSAARIGDCSLRVVRGGAWSSWPEDIRAAYREMAGADERYYSIGFRVARDIHK